jgi:S-adenosylmethionine hydrolase
LTIITLATDFGTRDTYVAEMKGVILGIAPSVRLVDVTHDVEPQQVAEAALAVDGAAAFFPRGTIHLAVVDPGVGTPRRGLVIVAGEQCFVGPDNGLFTPTLLRGGWTAFELAAPEYRRPAVSRTFHGRDVFAPAAAHLALGVEPERFGCPVRDPVCLPWPAARRTPAGVAGEVIHVDRFGNLITSIRAGDLPLDPVVQVAGRSAPVAHAYGSAAAGQLIGLVGSSGRLEVAVTEGSAALVLGVDRGAPVAVSSGSRSSPKK